MTDDRDHALRNLGDRMDNAQIGATAKFWALCEAQERGEHPSADYPTLIGLVGRRFTRLMFGVVLQELTRRPGMFTRVVAALANGVVREAAEALQVFPFAERVNAFNGLVAQMAGGLQIGVAEKVETPPPPQESGVWREVQKMAAAGLGLTTEGTEAWDTFADIHRLAAMKQQAQGPGEPPGAAPA